MKKIVIILSLLLIVSCVEAQTWQRTYGVKNSYDGNEAIETYDKGLFILTQTSTLFGFNSLLIKTDVNGNILWQKYTDTFMTVYQAVQSKDGGLILGGTINFSNSNNSYAFIIKLNSCGETDWTTQIYDTTPSYSTLYNLYIKPNGDLLVVSYGHNYQSPNDYPALIICLDSNGKYKWTYREGSNIDHLHINKDGSILSTGCLYTYDPGDTINAWIHSIVSLIDSNGRKIWSDIYGSTIHKYGADGLGFNSPNNTFKSIHQNYDSNSLKEGNFYMVSFDSSGKREWVQYFGDSARYEALNDGIALNDSTYIIAGASNTGNSGAEIHLIKINSMGHVLASKNLPLPLRAYSTSINPTYDKKYIVCNSVAVKHIDSVWLDSAHTRKIPITHTYYYAYVIKIDENLNLDTFNNSLHLNYDSLCSKKITSGDTLFFPKKYNVIRVDTMRLYTGIEEKPQADACGSSGIQSLKIYPNPFTDYTTIQFGLNKNAHINISIYDMLGREVAKLENATITAGNYVNRIDPEKYKLVQGVYEVKIYIDDNLTVRRIIRIN